MSIRIHIDRVDSGTLNNVVIESCLSLQDYKHAVAVEALNPRPSLYLNLDDVQVRKDLILWVEDVRDDYGGIDEESDQETPNVRTWSPAQDDPSYQGPGRYRHYKGSEYEVLGLASKEPEYATFELHGGLSSVDVYVVYQKASGQLFRGHRENMKKVQILLRPYENFNEWVAFADTSMIRRFQKIAQS